MPDGSEGDGVTDLELERNTDALKGRGGVLGIVLLVCGVAASVAGVGSQIFAILALRDEKSRRTFTLDMEEGIAEGIGELGLMVFFYAGLVSAVIAGLFFLIGAFMRNRLRVVHTLLLIALFMGEIVMLLAYRKATAT